METYEKPATATATTTDKATDKKKETKKTETTPPKEGNLQTKGPKKDGMVISIEAIKKPEGANKAQELKAMEEALKKATEEAHKQRIEITGEKDGAEAASLTQATSTSRTGL